MSEETIDTTSADFKAGAIAGFNFGAWAARQNYGRSIAWGNRFPLVLGMFPHQKCAAVAINVTYAAITNFLIINHEEAIKCLQE